MPAPNPLWSGDDDAGLREPEPDETERFVAQPRPRTEPPTEEVAVAEREPAPPAMPPPVVGPPPQAYRPPPPPPARPSAPVGEPSGPRRSGASLFLAGVAGMLLAGAIFALGAIAFHDGGSDSDASTASSGGKASKTNKPLGVSKGGTDATQAAAVYKAAGQSVVLIKRSGGSGTGFIVQDNTIVTNAHVVGSAQSVQVVLDPGIKPIDATVAGADESSDLAVLTVPPGSLQGRPALPLAESNDVGVGDLAVAIGYPLGLERTVTAGIISGIGRSIEAPNCFSIDKVLQTDAPVNPGNSGGPLLDAKGRVVGVNSQIATAGGGSGNVGIAFAIPSDTVAKYAPQLKAGRPIERAYLGVTSGQPADGSQGAQVSEVRAGGPAEQAGLEGAAVPGGSGGDVITKIDNTAIKSSDDVAVAIEDKKPGDRVDIAVRRNGTTKKLKLTLGSRPAKTGQSCGNGTP